MHPITFLAFFLIFTSNADEYSLSWYPKDKYFDSIKTPVKTKFSLINTEGVWEDNRGSYGIMKCLLSLITDKNEKTILNGLCEANDEKWRKCKDWTRG